MRLTPEQTRAIVAATHELAGPDASVRLFGSRLHDTLKGGDIDLLQFEELLPDGDTILHTATPRLRVAPLDCNAVRTAVADSLRPAEQHPPQGAPSVQDRLRALVPEYRAGMSAQLRAECFRNAAWAVRGD